MKKLTRPEFELIMLGESDIITTSGEAPATLSFPYTEGAMPGVAGEPATTEGFTDLLWNITMS